MLLPLIRKIVETFIIITFFFICLSVGFISDASGIKSTITIGGKSYDVVYKNNASTRALLDRFPATYIMSELNGNEIYKYLDYELPTNEKAVNQINAGDVMLYGSDCIVIFYKSFKTNYSYTYLGHIKDFEGTDDITVGSDVKVSFKSVPKSIKLSKSKLSLKKGKTYSLKLKNANSKKIKWISANKKVATVSKSGKIKAKKKGKTTIKAVYKNKVYRCRIVVR